MSETVTVTVVMTFKPEAVEAFSGAMAQGLEETKRFEGFRDFRALANTDNPCRLILIEEWDSVKAYQVYMSWRTETGVMNSVNEMLAEPSVVDYWHPPIAEAQRLAS